MMMDQTFLYGRRSLTAEEKYDEAHAMAFRRCSYFICVGAGEMMMKQKYRDWGSEG